MSAWSTPFRRKSLLDVATVLVLACIAAGLSYQHSSVSSYLTSSEAADTWFDSDVKEYFDMLGSRTSPRHSRTFRHPLLSLAIGVPVQVLQEAGLDVVQAARVFTASIAALWIGLFYALCRLIGIRLFDSALAALLCASSAAAFFFMVGPESFPLGSVSILVAGVIVAIAAFRSVPMFVYVAANVFALGITASNTFFSALATVLGNSRRSTALALGAAVLAVILLSGVQKVLFPSAVFPPVVAAVDRIENERSYLFSDEAHGSGRILMSSIFHSMIMPEIKIVAHPRRAQTMMATQLSDPGSGSKWGALAVGAWAALLAIGAWALFRLELAGRFRIFLGLSLVFAVGFPLIYTGRETFLYSLHIAPLLVLLAALGTLTRLRYVTLLLMGVTCVGALLNNSLMLNEAKGYYEASDEVSILLTAPVE